MRGATNQMSDAIVFVDADSMLFKAALTCDLDKYQMRLKYKKHLEEIKRNTFSDTTIVGVKGSGGRTSVMVSSPTTRRIGSRLNRISKMLSTISTSMLFDLGAIPATDGPGKQTMRSLNGYVRQWQKI